MLSHAHTSDDKPAGEHNATAITAAGEPFWTLYKSTVRGIVRSLARLISGISEPKHGESCSGKCSLRLPVHLCSDWIDRTDWLWIVQTVEYQVTPVTAAKVAVVQRSSLPPRDRDEQRQSKIYSVPQVEGIAPQDLSQMLNSVTNLEQDRTKEKDQLRRTNNRLAGFLEKVMLALLLTLLSDLIFPQAAHTAASTTTTNRFAIDFHIQHSGRVARSETRNPP